MGPTDVSLSFLGRIRNNFRISNDETSVIRVPKSVRMNLVVWARDNVHPCWISFDQDEPPARRYFPLRPHEILVVLWGDEGG